MDPLICLAYPRCFNSRTREGCDFPYLTISTKGSCFNSRTREGCDFIPSNSLLRTTMFQFTHPRGVRRKVWWVHPH